MKRRTTNLGFGSLDLLVLLVVLLIILALLLPAIVAARESARRAQCQKNLKSLGLALNNYHDTHACLPSGIISYGPKGDQYVATKNSKDYAEFSQVSAHTMLLPFLGDDQIETYNLYNFDLACVHLANSTSVETVVESYLCPSNPREGELLQPAYYPGFAAPTDYMLSLGGNALVTTISPHDPKAKGAAGYPAAYRPGAGAFNVNSFVRFEMIRDGLTKTILMGEGVGGAQVPHGSPEIGAEIPEEATPGKAIDQPWSQGYIGSTGGTGGYGSVFAATAYDAWYDAKGRLTAPDNKLKPWSVLQMNMNKTQIVRGTTYPRSFPEGITAKGKGEAPPPMLPVSMSPFRGYHRGMCFFLYGDGTVQAISDSIDPSVYVGLSSIAGDEKDPPED